MQHVGIDFAGGVELAQHTEALADPGAGAGAGAARADSPDDVEAGLPSFTDTAFFLYYDEVAEKYDMRDPLVVAPDGSEVECSKPSSLQRGVRYFCVVTLKDGEYAAEVLSESGAEGKDPEDYDAIWKVHLFNVPKEGEEDYGDEEPGHEDGMQYHTGAVVVGGGEQNVDHDTIYYADDKSIVNAPVNHGGSDSSGLAPTESNVFSLKGFGVFTKGDASRYGSFDASSELELSDDGMEGMSVLVRTGDVNGDDANELAYVKLKLPSSLKSPPTPFRYVEVPDEEQEGATIKSIVDCVFYFDGELKTLPDFANVPLTGTVYLTCTKAAPESGSSPEPQWQFAVATSPAQAETDDKVINIKLYDFEGGKMTMDYRTTFLTLCSNENETIEPDDVSTEFFPEAAPGTTPTGDEGKLQIKGFSEADDGSAPYKSNGEIVWGGKTIVSSDDSDGITIEYSDGTSDHIPAPEDGTDGAAASVTVSSQAVTGGTEVTITPYSGSTAGTPETFTVNDGDPGTSAGFGSITATATTLSPGSSATASVTPGGTDAAKTLAFSFGIPRGSDATAKDGRLTLNLGSLTRTFTANQAEDASVTVPAKRLIAGTNISITASGNDITISSSGGGGSTSGFRGTRRTLALMRYYIPENQFQAKFFTETWANGLMTASVIDDTWSNIEGGKVVMETV